MNKKLAFFAIAPTVACFGLLSLIFIPKSLVKNSLANENPDYYVLNLDNQNYPTDETSYVNVDNTIQSSGNYSFLLSYSNVKFAGDNNHCILGDGGKISRAVNGPLNGVTSVKASYTGGKLFAKYGQSSSSLHERLIPNDLTLMDLASTYAFNYFELEAEGEVTISSVQINYSCSSASNPGNIEGPTVIGKGIHTFGIKDSYEYDSAGKFYVVPKAENTITSVNLNGRDLTPNALGFYEFIAGPKDVVEVVTPANDISNATGNIYLWNGTAYELSEIRAIEYSAEEDNYVKVTAPSIDGYVPNQDYVNMLYTGDMSVDFYYTPVDIPSMMPDAATPNGSGTEESPYLIDSAANWAWFEDQVESGNLFEGKYLKMTKSLDFSNVSTYTDYFLYSCLKTDLPEGMEEHLFEGTFDGNNCSIRGINVDDSAAGYLGLFGMIGNSGVIKNLSLYGDMTFGYNSGAFSYVSAGKMINCNNYVNLEDVHTVRAIVGGFASLTLLEGSTDCQFIDCTNYGTIDAPNADRAAGIVGVGNPGNVTFNHCKNFGPISAKGNPAGIIGKYTSDTSYFNFLTCYNFAPIFSYSGGVNAGGILAYGYANTTITNCDNYGSVTVTANNNAGGIMSAAKFSLSITGCRNFAEVKTEGNNAGNGAGGILAYSNNEEGTPYQKSITNCMNFGNVKASRFSAGGIYGWDNNTAAAIANGKTIITSCLNFGNVSTPYQGQCGGIAGVIASTNGASSISSDCYNYGVITSKTASTTGDIYGKSN